MKIFGEENGKEIVFIQCSDLRFLCNNNHISEEIKSLIPMNVFGLSNQDEYMKFEDKEFINFLKNSYFILDFNKFIKMTDEEINNEIKNNIINKNKVYEQIKKLSKKERKNHLGLYSALKTLEHYEISILKLIEEKQKNNLQGKSYINTIN